MEHLNGWAEIDSACTGDFTITASRLARWKKPLTKLQEIGISTHAGQFKKTEKEILVKRAYRGYSGA